jgi:hypothetical protein
MAEIPPFIPPKLVEAVRSTSTRLADLSTRVSKSIETVEVWLAKLPGKVEAEVHEAASQPNEDILAVSFDRGNSSSWVLWVRDAKSTPDGQLRYDPVHSWVPVSQVDVDTKLRVIRLLPKLVEALLFRLHDRQKALEEATVGLEQFISSVPGKEGK